jgi:hypothetical protein
LCHELFHSEVTVHFLQIHSHGPLRQARGQEDSRHRRFVWVNIPRRLSLPLHDLSPSLTNLPESSIGFGAAEILLEAGAHVTIISSSEEKVKDSVARLGSPQVDGRVADVRDEEGITKLLLELAPLDHIVFSSVDKIIRGALADADLDEARHLFGVKFWGSVAVAKGMLCIHFQMSPEHISG